MTQPNEGLQQEGTLDPGTQEAEPEWKERFGDPDKLYEAWQNAEKRITQQGEELGRLRPLEDQIGSLEEQMNMLVQQQSGQAQNGFDPMSHPLIAGAQQALDQGDVVGMLAAFQALTQQTAPVSESTSRLTEFDVARVGDHVASHYGADDDMRVKATEMIQNNPVLSKRFTDVVDDPNATVDDLVPIVDTAFQLVQGGQVAEQKETSLAQQQAAQEAARQRKIEQEGITGSGARVASPDEQKDAWKRIMDQETGGIKLGPQ